MKYNGFVKSKYYESDLFGANIYYKSDKIRGFNSSSQSDNASCGSISSNSTTYTANLKGKDDSSGLRTSKYLCNKRLSNNYKKEYSAVLGVIYNVINDLYDEEILPTLHEIRRKLKKYDGSSIEAPKLLNLCSKDDRYRIIRLDAQIKNSNDIQNQWAVLIKDNPFSDFNKQVDDDLLELVSNYLIFISSYKYVKLVESNMEKHSDADHVSADMDEDADGNQVSEYDLVLMPIDEILKVGGRYLFAEHLKNKGPKRLSRLPLGQILNIVQKLTDIGLLVYRGNFLVPVANSNAASNRLIFNLNKSVDKHCLAKLKQNVISLFHNGSKIALSSLPIVYRSTFGEDLNYSAIGYEKLSEFIKNEVPSCRIIKRYNQFMVYVPLDGRDEVASEYRPEECFGEKKKVSQTKLSASHTTLLYPLKISPAQCV